MQAPALFKDGYRVGQAIVRVLGDSTKTHEIHRVEEITGRPRYRQLQREMEATAEGRRLLEERPELSSDRVDYDHLRTLPESTLGGAYVHHLDSHGLTADYQAAATRHVEDPTMAYLMRRFRQTHDVWHALIGLGVEGYEEVLVHWFTFGQLRLPVSAMIMLFGSVKHIVLEQRWGTMRHSMMEAYRAGRDAAPLLSVYWEDHWEKPLEEIRARYNVRPLERRWLE
jgi:ubiquinone biosynthesis protein COQ4